MRCRLVVAAACLSAAGCSTAPPAHLLPPPAPTPTPVPAPPSATHLPPPPSTAPAPLPPPASRFLPVKPGDYQYSLAGSDNRHYALHVPPAYDGTKPLAAVIVLHGRGGSAVTARSYGFSDEADRDGFLVLYPEAVPPSRMWFTGLETGARLADDVSYVKQVLDDAAKIVNLDAHRVYAVGYSNGGTLAADLAGALPGRIAAVAAVNANIAIKDRQGNLITVARPTQPVSALLVNGREDLASPYAGGPSAVLGGNNAVGASEGASWWAESIRCAAPAKVSRSSESERTEYADCADGTVVMLISYAGGHEWPKTLSLEPKRPPLSTADFIVDFFKSRLYP